MNEFRVLNEDSGEELFAAPEQGWRASDDDAILMLYDQEEWPFWRWRGQLSRPYAYRELYKRAFELKVISRWMYYWLVIRNRVFCWLPESWDVPEGLFDEEE